ncbi:hypothetical protein [Oceanobacillus sp. 1P07AA]|uniref:hypothetical protein n=1 Tax=Oceanobacillus sp. 1P07AA TaxID=3132293 RepID=UPI0039A6B546
MGAIFILLGIVGLLVGLVLAIIGVIKKEKKASKAFILLVSSIIFVAIGGTMLGTDSEETAESKEDELPSKIDERIEYYATEVFGEDSVDEASFLEGNAYVYIIGSESWDEETALFGMHSDTIDFLEKLQNEEEITSVQVDITQTFSDSYGNQEDKAAYRTDFSRETIDKINYENINPDSVPEIADEYWVHDAMK